MNDTPVLFDKTARLLSKRRSLMRDAADRGFLASHVARDMAERLAITSRRFDRAIALGGPCGLAAGLLEDAANVGTVIRADTFLADPLGGGPAMIADNESLPFTAQCADLVVSLLDLHDINDLPGSLVQIRRVLKPDGLLLAGIFGPNTLRELRQSLMRAEAELTGGASARVHPFAEIKGAGGLLQRAGFALPVVDSDELIVRYDTLFDVVRDLRALGATNALVRRNRGIASRNLFLRAAEIYAQDHADADGRLRATFEIISMSGWAPHDSQPKPLKPGSAKMRLAEALNASDGAKK